MSKLQDGAILSNLFRQSNFYCKPQSRITLDGIHKDIIIT